jgi:L-asparaginase
MRKILLLALGGTIACTRTKKGLSPKLKAGDLLRFVSVPPGVIVRGIDFLKRTIVFPWDWVALSRKIFSEFNQYDGFVVTLGTDTLAFVASALSLMLESLSKPVVLTGAMTTIRASQSDGRRNLKDAIRLASEESARGVFVVFNGKIIDGSTVSKVRSQGKAAFESINSLPLGYLVRERLRWRNKPPRPKGKLQLRTQLDTRVITVKLAPQLDADFFKSLASYRGILVEGYGDGNVPTNLVPVLSRLAKKRIVVLASQCTYGSVLHQYEGGAALMRNGALSSHNMTTEMACVKLMWALGQSKDRSVIRRSWDT